MKRGLLILCLVLSGSVGWAAAKKESDLKKAKDSTNQALDKFADGVHDALDGAKKESNTFLQDVDDSIHRLWHKLTAPSKENKTK